MLAGSVAVAALSVLAACQAAETADATAAPAVAVVAVPAQAAVVPAPSTVILAPGPPPKAQVEFRPPPPQNAPNAIWQPGHWRWLGQNGANWQWVAGSYVMPPPGYHQWIPGQWSLQAGGWAWAEGHWS
jgi:hypothetical protein